MGIKTLLLGLDAFDPTLFERLHEQGRLPNLGRYVQAGGYSRFAVANPPQSEVSWTSIATGLNPGGHGMFDFVHRNPATYQLSVSMLPTKRGWLGTQFVPPFTAPTLFEQAAAQGYPATALWWPALFPARQHLPMQTIPGLGTPDIHGRLGVGTLFTPDTDSVPPRKTTLAPLVRQGAGTYRGVLLGPQQEGRGAGKGAALELTLRVTGEQSAACLLGNQRLDLVVGQWSPIFSLSFKLGPFVSVQALTRAILTQLGPEVRLYLLPLQLHPLHPLWPYATPRGFIREVWQACGPFLTLGWPQDTTALEEGWLTDDQFLALCDDIFQTRERVLMHQLAHFREGVIGAVFDTLDRVQHMFWRHRPAVVEQWYEKLDGLVGRIAERLDSLGGPPTRLLILSDHGFSDFSHKVHLNRWLIDQGWLEAEGDRIAWGQSQAYALGLNSLYLNQAGREGQGQVPATEREATLATLRDTLLRWRGPDGRAVVQQAWTREEAFEGPLLPYAPDLVVGYAPGYRASAQTGLGGWEAQSLEANHDHWGGDHCMDPAAVPGVLFANRALHDFPHPSYRDIPALAIGAAPPTLPPSTPPPLSDDEGERIIEKRLRDLGYL